VVCVVFGFLGLGWLQVGLFTACVNYVCNLCRTTSCDGFGYSGSPA